MSAEVDPWTHERWSIERIVSVHPWTPNLFSLTITRPTSFRFTPGQWARLGVLKTSDDGSQRLVWRAYSIASASWEEQLNFYSIVVPDGEFTSELSRLAPGDRIWIEKQPYGFLTADRFDGGDELWMLASGTGLAPFLSILWEPDTWTRFQHLYLVHSVRESNELTYQDWIQAWQQPGGLSAALAQHLNDADTPSTDTFPAEFHYLPVVTRGQTYANLTKRITTLLENGDLERAAGRELTLERSRIMLCGNPEMVEDLRAVLGKRGFSPVRRAKGGQIVVENYW